MLYKVVIHYEGGWLFEIEANSEDEAKETAEEQFASLDDRELVAIFQISTLTTAGRREVVL